MIAFRLQMERLPDGSREENSRRNQEARQDRQENIQPPEIRPGNIVIRILKDINNNYYTILGNSLRRR